MKDLILATILLFIAFSVSAQSEKWRQKNARINFVFTPQAEFVKIGGKYSPTASFCASIAFDNTFFIGGYMTKKAIRQYDVFPANPGADIDVNYQHAGVEFLYSMRLGLYRTQGGHYVRPKIRIVFGARLGGGTFWLDNIDKEKISTREYFYFIQPQVGVAYPLNDFITLHGGACFTTALSVDKLNNYFEMMDFTGPGGYVALKISLFR